MLKHSLQFKLSQKLSPQQIQLMKLIQLPTQAFEQRLQEELVENPALENGKEEISELDDYNDIDDYSDDYDVSLIVIKLQEVLKDNLLPILTKFIVSLFNSINPDAIADLSEFSFSDISTIFALPSLSI